MNYDIAKFENLVFEKIFVCKKMFFSKNKKRKSLKIKIKNIRDFN